MDEFVEQMRDDEEARQDETREHPNGEPDQITFVEESPSQPLYTFPSCEPSFEDNDDNSKMDHLYIDVNNENEATIYPVNTVITEPIPTTNAENEIYSLDQSRETETSTKFSILETKPISDCTLDDYENLLAYYIYKKNPHWTMIAALHAARFILNLICIPSDYPMKDGMSASDLLFYSQFGPALLSALLDDSLFNAWMIDIHPSWRILLTDTHESNEADDFEGLIEDSDEE